VPCAVDHDLKSTLQASAAMKFNGIDIKDIIQVDATNLSIPIAEFFMLGQLSDGTINADQEKEVCDELGIKVSYDCGKSMGAIFDNRDSAFLVCAELMRRYKVNIFVVGSVNGISKLGDKPW
jgi:hypothetical protein